MPPARSLCPGHSSLDTDCAPAEYGSYQEARTGKISQIEVSTLLGEPRTLRANPRSAAAYAQVTAAQSQLHRWLIFAASAVKSRRIASARAAAAGSGMVVF